jgi:hypothetical protein
LGGVADRQGLDVGLDANICLLGGKRERIVGGRRKGFAVNVGNVWLANMVPSSIAGSVFLAVDVSRLD